MAKINVYLPDDLAAAVRAAGFPVSPVCQYALAETVRRTARARRAIAAIRDPEQDPGALLERLIEGGARITQRLAAAVEAAREAGRDPGADSGPLSTASLLAGMLRQGDNLAIQILRALDADPDELASAVETLGAGGADGGADGGGAAERPADGGGSGRDTATPAAREALAAAFEAAIGFAHNYVGCEHLLVGLAADASSAAGRVLASAGVDAASARRAVTSALAGFGAASERRDAQREVALGEVLDRLDRLGERLDALERGATP